MEEKSSATSPGSKGGPTKDERSCIAASEDKEHILTKTLVVTPDPPAADNQTLAVTSDITGASNVAVDDTIAICDCNRAHYDDSFFSAIGSKGDKLTKEVSGTHVASKEETSSKTVALTTVPPVTPVVTSASSDTIGASNVDVHAPVLISDFSRANSRKVRRVIERIALPTIRQPRRGPAPARVSFKGNLERLPGPSSPFPMIDVAPVTPTKFPLPSISLEAIAESIARKLKIEVQSDDRSPAKLRKVARGLDFVDLLKLSRSYLENQQGEELEEEANEEEEEEEEEEDNEQH